MTRSLRRSLLGIVLVAAMLPMGSRESGAQSAKAEWTILFYHDADCDLELPMLEDIKEMAAVGSTKDVNVVMLVDRAAKGDKAENYSNDPVLNLPNWTTAKLLRAERNRLVELADWGEVNMGDPAVLKRFIETGVARFPANKYALIFSDHGAS